MSQKSSSGKKHKFPIPNSLEEAYKRRQTVIEEMKDLDLNLGSNKGRESGSKHFQWRRQATWAKRIKEAELAFLKNWIRERIAQEREQKSQVRAEVVGLNLDDPRGLIQASYNLLCSLWELGKYDEKDRAVIATLRNYLRKRG